MMQRDFLVSIIVPIYRGEKYLRCCVDSILQQSYRNIEVILVDDGSDDKSPQLCDMYENKDGRVKVIHKTNGGANSARVAGIKVATGDYISYIDSDDWIEADYIETMVKIVTTTACKVVNTGIINDYGKSREYRYPYFPQGFYENDKFISEILPYIFYTGKFFQHGIEPYLCNKLIERSLALKYQLRPGNKDGITDGLMVSIPAILDGKSVYILHECKYHYRVRPNSNKRITMDTLPQIICDNIENWRKTLELTGFYGQCKDQFNIMIFYWLALKTPGYFDNELFLELYGGIEAGKKIVVYGAGVAGINVIRYVKNNRFGVKLVAWIDSNTNDLKKYYAVDEKEVIKELEYDYVLIAVMRREAYVSIKKDLRILGVEKEKIRWVNHKLLDKNCGLISL